MPSRTVAGNPMHTIRELFGGGEGPAPQVLRFRIPTGQSCKHKMCHSTRTEKSAVISLSGRKIHNEAMRITNTFGRSLSIHHSIAIPHLRQMIFRIVDACMMGFGRDGTCSLRIRLHVSTPPCLNLPCRQSTSMGVASLHAQERALSKPY
jgi:hypothetical protein